MNKKKRKRLRQHDFNAQPWHKRIVKLLQDKTAKLSTKEREFLTKCYGQQRFGERQEKLLRSILDSYSAKPQNKRKYPGYNIPGYDIPNKQGNLLQELNRPDLQSV